MIVDHYAGEIAESPGWPCSWPAIHTRLSTFSAIAMTFVVPYAIGAPVSVPLGLPEIPVPFDNLVTQDKALLGEKLFNDKRLSGDGTISCATCHDSAYVFSDGRPVAQGINNARGVRNVPSIVNIAYSNAEFWDGRRANLEAQALDPFLNSAEHGLKDYGQILRVVRGDSHYVADFNAAFGTDPITIEHVAKAVASFERTLVSGNSAFDRYQYGGEYGALNASAARGLDLFRGRAGCSTCHSMGNRSALLTDNKFHRLGVGHKRIENRLGELAAQYANAPEHDAGKAMQANPQLSELGRFLVTLNPEDIGGFKTPSLRNVAMTAPYMHDGSIGTLEEAIDLEIYYRGLEANRPLILTPREKADLAEFLRALTSPEYSEQRAPQHAGVD